MSGSIKSRDLSKGHKFANYGGPDNQSGNQNPDFTILIYNTSRVVQFQKGSEKFGKLKV